MVLARVKEYSKDILYGAFIPYRIPTEIQKEEDKSGRGFALENRNAIEKIVIDVARAGTWYGQYLILDQASKITEHSWWVPLLVTNAVSLVYEVGREIVINRRNKKSPMSPLEEDENELHVHLKTHDPQGREREEPNPGEAIYYS